MPRSRREPVDAVHELREGRAVLGAPLVREAHQLPQQLALGAARRAVVHVPSRHVPRLSGAPTAPVSHGVWMPGSPRQLKFSLKAGQSVSLRHARAVLLSTRGTERRPLSGHRRSAALPSGDSVSGFGPSTMQIVPSESIANCCALKSSNMYPRDLRANQPVCRVHPIILH